MRTCERHRRSATGRRRHLWLALALCLPPIPLTGQACRSTPEDSLAVRGVAEGIVAADNARDIDRVLGFYAPDAVLHPPGELAVQGRDWIAPRYVRLFADFDPAIVSELESVRVCGDLAVVAGRNGGALRGRGSVPDRRLSDAFVMVLKRVGEAWLITRLIWHSDRG